MARSLSSSQFTGIGTLLFSLFVSFTVGCSTQRAPIRTALVDLTGESRVVHSRGGPLGMFKIVSHHQVVSVNGLLNMPDIGQELQFTGENDVTTAVGVAVVQSYRLIGETEPPEASAVTRVRSAIEDVQALASQATMVTLRIKDEKDEIERLTREIHALIAHRKSAQNELIQGEIEDRQEARGATESRLVKLQNRREKVETQLAAAEQRLRETANVPGIIVARWNAQREGGASAHVGRSGSASISAANQRSGFVILGGIRIVSIVFGEDFWFLLHNLRDHEKKYVTEIGIATHLVQARQVAYTSDLRRQQQAMIELAFDQRHLDPLESARVAGYWSFVEQFSNAGNLDRVKWRREPFCCVCALDLPGLAEPDHQSLQKFYDVHDKPVDPASYQGWRTVTANVMYLGGPRPWGVKTWTMLAKRYEDDRPMWRARACPFCSPEANPDGRDPVVLPGTASPR